MNDLILYFRLSNFSSATYCNDLGKLWQHSEIPPQSWDCSGQITQLVGAPASAGNSGRHFSLFMPQYWSCDNTELELHSGFCCQIGRPPPTPSAPPPTPLRSLLALSLSLFVPLSSPQLFHNIQRTGAHDPGRQHTRGPEVVQQQPRAWDAYELACIWGTTSNQKQMKLSPLLLIFFHLSPFLSLLTRNTTQTKPVLLQRRRNQTEPHPLPALTMWLPLVTVAG